MKAESALTGHLAEAEEEKEKLLRQIEANNNKQTRLKELINNLDCIAQTDKKIWAQWEALLDLAEQHATGLRASLSAIPTPTTITQEVQDVIDKWDALLSVTEAKIRNCGICSLRSRDLLTQARRTSSNETQNFGTEFTRHINGGKNDRE